MTLMYTGIGRYLVERNETKMAEMAKEIPKRSEVPKELTWNLESIFETDEAWEKEFTALKEDIAQITAYQGKLGNSSDDLYHMFVLQDQLAERVGKLFTYAHMRNDEDNTNDLYQALILKAENLFTLFSSNMSFIVREIIQINEERLTKFLREKPVLQNYKITLDDTSFQRKHVLSEQEAVL